MSTHDPAAGERRPPAAEPDGEASYLNALLTTIAKGPHTEVTLTWGMGVPNLRPLADKPEELEWIDTLPFRYTLLDGRRVIALALTLAGVRFYQFWKHKGEFAAILALPNDQQSHMRFGVKRFKSPEGITQLTIKQSLPDAETDATG